MAGRIGLESLALGRAQCGAEDIRGLIQTSSTQVRRFRDRKRTPMTILHEDGAHGAQQHLKYLSLADCIAKVLKRAVWREIQSTAQSRVQLTY